MKYCPNCQAEVEGLLYRCDCCGASLIPKKKRFFTCGIYELPQCFFFSSLTREMIDNLQPTDCKKYEAFLKEVGIRMVCYPESVLADGNIKERLYYSQKKKHASLTIIVNYNNFVCADKDKKAFLVAQALYKGIHSLQVRLLKSNLSIEDIVAQVDALFDKYSV